MTALNVLDDLNPEQRAVALHGEQPLLVVAGAGSGKTLTLTARMACLVAAGADPGRLMLVTFSRRAAAEMERRAGHLLQQALGLPAGRPPPALPWCGTFHSIGARLLREHAASIGLAEDFSVIDRADAQDLMAEQRTRLGLHRSHQRFPLAPLALTILSRVVNGRAALATVLQDHFPWCLAAQDGLHRLFDAYVAAKQAQRVLDYDDLLLYWQLMMDQPALAQRLATRFDHVLVDEMQDTNRLQDAIVHALRPGGRGLTVVGDDAQSIYAFRSAEVDNLLHFAARFEPPATTRLLERNYRSTRPILDAANAVIALAPRRIAKTLWTARDSSQRPRLVSVLDEAAQAAWVADEVLRQREDGVLLRRQAVLFRTAHHSAALELELTRRRIPFVKFGGLRFLEAAHVKDALALLRWTHNPRCRLAGLRVARLVAGIGPATALQLLDTMDAAADPAATLLAWTPPPRAGIEWAALRDTCRRLLHGGQGWPEDLRLATAWLAGQLPRLYDDARVRLADLEQLGRLAALHGTRERFLTELVLDPPEASGAEAGVPYRDDDYLVLSTIHSAKGQEWSAVHLLSVVDGCMPSDLATGSAREVEEERRLLYVAMTRARDQLNLLVPQRFHVTQQRALGGRHLYAPRSRFIPSDLERWFELAEPLPPAGGDRGDEGPLPHIDLAAQARAAWAR